MADKKDQNTVVIKGGFYEYPSLQAKRKITFTKWGTPTRSHNRDEKPATKTE